MKKSHLVITTPIMWTLALISSPVQSSNSEEIQIRGFASLAARYISDPSLGYHRSYQLKGATSDVSLLSDSTLGLQTNIPMGKHLEGIIQVAYRDQISHRATDYIDWAVIRYQMNRNTSLRIGRTHTDIQIASDHQNIGYVHPWVSPPTEFYSAVNLFTRLDGIDVEFNAHLNDGDIRLKGGFGQTSQKVKAGGITTKMDIGNSGYLTLGYSVENWKFRASQAWINVDSIEYQNQASLSSLKKLPDPVWPGVKAIIEEIESSGELIKYTSAGLKYDNHQWFMQTEVSLTDSDWQVMTPTLSGYVAGGIYHDDLTVFAAFSRITPTSDRAAVPLPNYALLPAAQQPVVKQLYGKLSQALNANRADQFTVSSGIRWDFHNNAAIKLQYDFSEIRPGGAGLWTEQTEREQPHSVHSVTLMLDVVF